jgi:hypothetical protein
MSFENSLFEKYHFLRDSPLKARYSKITWIPWWNRLRHNKLNKMFFNREWIETKEKNLNKLVFFDFFLTRIEKKLTWLWLDSKIFYVTRLWLDSNEILKFWLDCDSTRMKISDFDLTVTWLELKIQSSQSPGSDVF